MSRRKPPEPQAPVIGVGLYQTARNAFEVATERTGMTPSALGRLIITNWLVANGYLPGSALIPRPQFADAASVAVTDKV
jgi:hypothetical protein